MENDKGSGRPAPPRTPTFWRLLRRNNPNAIRAFQAGRGRNIGLVLTTTGRRSGLPRKTPLQYEELDGVIYIGSARGEAADWYRNLLATPDVHVQIGTAGYSARAEPLARPTEVLEFLRLRLERHPFMMRMMLLVHGVPPWAADRGLHRLAERLAAVALRDLRSLDEVGVRGTGEAPRD